MNGIELNTIFYSKGNIELAYELKKACRNISANVFNIRQFSEMVYTLNGVNISILFLDYDKMEIPQAIMDFVVNYNFNNPINIVFITENDVPGIEFDNRKFYKVNPKSIQSDLFKLEPQLKYTVAMKKPNSIDVNNLNQELTDYLISNGFSTLHKGFSYMKECIVYAVTQKGSVGSLNSEIYPYVAAKFNTIVENVERNIRNAVQQAKKINFNNSDICKLSDSTKMSNKVIIGYIVERSLANLRRA